MTYTNINNSFTYNFLDHSNGQSSGWFDGIDSSSSVLRDENIKLTYL